MRLPRSPLTTTLCLLILSLSNPTWAARATATSFCKCICFNNSTIIALNPPPSSNPASSLHKFDIRSPDPEPDPFIPLAETSGKKDTKAEDSNESRASRPHHKLTCADCTRAFCLDYNLPICKDAREEDVFTTCFQRDSLKDETVVVVFIFATAGLLAWALVKPWLDRLRERNTFTPLLSRHDGPPLAGGTGAARPGRNPFRRDAGDLGGIGNAAGEGGISRSNSRQGLGAASFPPAPTGMHADQDAEDIVSDSRSRP